MNFASVSLKGESEFFIICISELVFGVHYWHWNLCSIFFGFYQHRWATTSGGSAPAVGVGCRDALAAACAPFASCAAAAASARASAPSERALMRRKTSSSVVAVTPYSDAPSERIVAGVVGVVGLGEGRPIG